MENYMLWENVKEKRPELVSNRASPLTTTCHHWTAKFSDLSHRITFQGKCSFLFWVAASYFINCNSCRLQCSSVWRISLRLHCTSHEAAAKFSLHFHIWSCCRGKSQLALLHKPVALAMSEVFDHLKLVLMQCRSSAQETAFRSYCDTLGSDTVQSPKWPSTFRGNILPASSGYPRAYVLWNI